MEDILKKLDPEKRDRIINSAIEEFSLYPYEKASTNNIVKNAGISKGLLFHYFESKRDLYDKITGFVINKLYDEVRAQINWDERDLLERIKKLVIAKMKIGRIYPNMFDFIVKALSNKDAKKVEDIYEFYGKYGITFEQVLKDIYSKNVDYSLFSNPAEMEKNLNIVQWTLEKYSEQKLLDINQDEALDYDQIADEIDEYLDILKRTIYK
jgi:hypothetical protein